MTKYREILRLKSLGFSERNIAHSCGVSRNTVAKVVKKAAEIKLSWLQSAGSNRRFCGAKRTRCGASGLNL